MSKARKVAHRARRILTVLAVAVGTVTATATAAAADDIHRTCESGTGYIICFEIARNGIGNEWRVHVGIDVFMSPADAVNILEPPGDEFSAVIRGSDPFSDNTEDFMFLSWAAAGPHGLSAEFHRICSGADLNEDPEGGNDELYARVKLFDHRTGKNRTFDSDQIHHNYHP